MAKKRMQKLRHQAAVQLESRLAAFDSLSWRDQKAKDLAQLAEARKEITKTLCEAAQKFHRDPMGLLAVATKLRSTMSGCFDYKSFVTRKFGDGVIDNLYWRNEWTAPVWQNEPWFQNSIWQHVHHVHDSGEEICKIAYTRRVDGIKRCIRTRVSPGKYLTEFFKDVLTQDEIRAWAERQISYSYCKGKVEFVENNDPDAWVHLYTRGPHSCMAGKDAVKVYARAGNGLRLAYIRDPLEKSRQLSLLNRIDNLPQSFVARAIVRDDEQGNPLGYVRIYAIEQRWQTKLQEDLAFVGYKNMVNLDGVELERIDVEDTEGLRVLCPYIDAGRSGSQRVSIKDDCLLLGPEGPNHATFTSGLLRVERVRTCWECEQNWSESHMTQVMPSEEYVCPRCTDRHYHSALGIRGEGWYRKTETVYCRSDHQFYFQESVDLYDLMQCASSNEWYKVKELVSCGFGRFTERFIRMDDVVYDNLSGLAGHFDDATEIDNKWVANAFVGVCPQTGAAIDVRCEQAKAA